MRKRVAIYCVDQDARTTSSLGIHNYTTGLIASLCRYPDPGFDLILWVSAQNRVDIVPPQLPGWVHVSVCPGSYGTGLPRIFADHALASVLTLRDRVGLVHFPKGWIPAIPLSRSKIVATIHDTIIQFYRLRYPNYFPQLKTRYFDWATQHTLKRAEHIIAPSNFSAGELRALIPEVDGRISVIPTGGICEKGGNKVKSRSGVVVLGSSLPHKKVSMTLHLLGEYARARSIPLEVTITAVTCWEEITTKESPPEGVSIRYLGRVSHSEVFEIMEQSRALVFLSEIEGLGLPVLEAYSVRTPVCHRHATALAEVLEGAPGGWDGMSTESFFSAMDDVLSMEPAGIEAVRDSLARRYNWEVAVRKTISLYRQLLE